MLFTIKYDLKVINRYWKCSPLAPVQSLAMKFVQVATNVFLEKDVLEKSNCNEIDACQRLVLIIWSRFWVSNLHWNLEFHTCNGIEAYNRNTPWKKISIDDVITLVVNHVYFIKYWRHEWTSSVKETYRWKFQIDNTSRTQNMAWSLAVLK